MRAELSADREQGAGHGLLRIAGLPAGPGPVHFSLRRNQGTAPFLGSDARWQATEAWHPIADARADGPDAITAPLGPPVIDPIVGQPTNVTYLLTVAVGAMKQATSLKVIRPLFGTGAAAEAVAASDTSADAARRQAEEDARRREEEEAARRRAAEEEEKETRRLEEEAERRRLADEAARQAALDEAVAKARRRRRMLVGGVGLGLLLLVGGAVGAWYGCVIPGFGPERCRTIAATPPPAGQAALSCTGLDAAGCYQVGERALQQRQLEPARQLLQQAAGLGSIEASIAVGRMYDPDTWSAETSPAAQPNWETAVFWYEKAARQGNVAAQVVAGRLLCRNAKSDLERGQGRAYLEQAANAGNEDARQFLSTCQ